MTPSFSRFKAERAIWTKNSVRDSKVSGVLFLVSVTQFILIDMIAESIYPGYNVDMSFVSDLGGVGSPTYFIWNGSLLALGIMWIIGSYFYLGRKKGAEGKRFGEKLAFVSFLLIGIGAINVALVPFNVNAIVHSFGATTAFVFGGVSPVLTFRLTKSPFRFMSLAIGILALTLTVSMIFGKGFGLGPGGIERAAEYPELIWAISLGGYLLGGN